jgi:hypothetical protein
MIDLKQCIVFDSPEEAHEPFAQIGLRLPADHLLDENNRGDMLQFSILNGGRHLWQRWFSQQTLYVQGEQGEKMRVRVAAFPTDRQGHGYIEFV